MKLFLVILLILVCTCLVVIIYDVNRFVIRHYQFESAKLTKEYRFVLLSDLHGKAFGQGNRTLLQEIEKIKPDGIYIAGDMLTAKPGGDFSVVVELLKTLYQKYPIYYANGNHEHRLRLYPETYKDMAERYGEAMSGIGIDRLINEHTSLPEYHINVFGLEIEKEYYKRFRKPYMDKEYLTEQLGNLPEGEFNILIAHNPEYFEAYVEYGVDLVLSGHIHGGIANIPMLGGVISPSLRLFPKFDGGLFEGTYKEQKMVVKKQKDSEQIVYHMKQKAYMILSRGLGTHTLPIRFLNPGELILVTLKPD